LSGSARRDVTLGGGVPAECPRGDLHTKSVLDPLLTVGGGEIPPRSG